MELNASRTAARTDAAGEPILMLDQRSRALGPVADPAGDARAWASARTRRSGRRLRSPGGDCRLPCSSEDGGRDRLAAYCRALWRAGGDRALASDRTQPRGRRRHGRRAASGAGDRRARLAGEPALKGYHLLPSVRGDLLLKLGRYEAARAAFEAAAALCGNKRERDLLERRAAEAAARAPQVQFANGEVGATADSHGETHTRRGKPRSAKDDQGSLF